jgi:hypothetical protein
VLMLYTEDVGRRKDEGNRKEYTISDMAYRLGCDKETRTDYSS